MKPHTFWLSAASITATLGGIFVGASAGLAATRTDYTFWAGAPMVVAYVLFLAAVACTGAAIRGARIPFAKKVPWRVAGQPLERSPVVRRAARDTLLMGQPWWRRLWLRLRLSRWVRQ